MAIMGRSFGIHFQIHSINIINAIALIILIVETRAYRDINIIFCIKQLKKFEGGGGGVRPTWRQFLF